jgi:2-hydroxy-3-oxopropionate reductase
MNIGFIGLGIMGKPMAHNLIKAGHKLICYDIVQKNVEEVAAYGATSADSIKQVAQAAKVIITMLPNSLHVKSAVEGEDGLLAHAQQGTILIDMSSINPIASKEICEACKKHGVIMIDAPVSGGEPKAIDGTLSIMCGGDKTAFDQIHPILSCMGTSITYCGEIGAGNTTKLANQIIVAGNIALVAEALTLAKLAGVDPETVFQAIKGGLAGSTVMNAKVPMMLAGNFKPGFKIDLHIKDLDNAIQTGHSVGSPLPLTASVMEMLENLHASGNGNLDHSALALYYEKLSGTSIA